MGAPSGVALFLILRGIAHRPYLWAASAPQLVPGTLTDGEFGWGGTSVKE